MIRLSLSAATLAIGVALAGANPALAQDDRYPPPPYYPAEPAPSDPVPSYPPPAYQDDDDLVVYGRYGPRPEDAETASSRVRYADLDLYYPEDRRELRRRISNTARYLCDRLGESDSGFSYGSSCRDEATRDALRRVGTIEAQWAPRETAWVR